MLDSICPKCKTPVQFIANNTMAKCPQCRSIYMSEDAENEMREHHQYVRAELLVGEKFLFDKQWQPASSCFARLVKSYPLEIDAWMGLARAITHEQTYFGLSGKEYILLLQCLSKVQTLQGALTDDSWRAYRDKYEQYRDQQRMELQSQCEKLAYWVDNKQDGDTKMAARLVLLSTAFLLLTLGFVLFVIDTRLWFLIPITGAISAILCLVIRRLNAKANISQHEKQMVCQRCKELQQKATYWNVEIFFRQDIRNILESNK